MCADKICCRALLAIGKQGDVARWQVGHVAVYTVLRQHGCREGAEFAGMAVGLVAADAALREGLHIPFTGMRVVAGGTVHVHALFKAFAGGKELVLGAMHIQFFRFAGPHNILVKIVTVGIARAEAEDGFLWRLQAGMAYSAHIQFLPVLQGGDVGDMMRLFFLWMVGMENNMFQGGTMTALAVNAIDHLVLFKFFLHMPPYHLRAFNTHHRAMAAKAGAGYHTVKFRIGRRKPRAVGPAVRGYKIRQGQLEILAIVPVKIGLGFAAGSHGNIKAVGLLQGIVRICRLEQATITYLHMQLHAIAVLE